MCPLLLLLLECQDYNYNYKLQLVSRPDPTLPRRKGSDGASFPGPAHSSLAVRNSLRGYGSGLVHHVMSATADLFRSAFQKKKRFSKHFGIDRIGSSFSGSNSRGILQKGTGVYYCVEWRRNPIVFDFTVGKVRSLPRKVQSGSLNALWAWQICQFQRFGKQYRLFPRIKG